jgi:hypothetical protein
MQLLWSGLLSVDTRGSDQPVVEVELLRENEKASIHRSNAHRSRVPYLYHNRPIQQVPEEDEIRCCSHHTTRWLPQPAPAPAAFSKVTMELLR